MLRISKLTDYATVILARLAAEPTRRFTAAQILDALEGPVALTECAGVASHCGIERTCRVGHSWQRVNLAIRRSLQEISLLELAGLSMSVSRSSALDRGLSVVLKRQPA